MGSDSIFERGWKNGVRLDFEKKKNAQKKMEKKMGSDSISAACFTLTRIIAEAVRRA